jgi:hypothetical protein
MAGVTFTNPAHTPVHASYRLRGLVVTMAASTSDVSGQAAMNQWQRIFEIVYSQVVPTF